MSTGLVEVRIYMPSDNDIAAQIDRILSSRWFSRSERLCRFVRFAASHALSLNADRLKEYILGVEVFDRTPEYDPRIDPIVRVEARRLRAKLRAYYASAGRDDQIRIDFPKGTYTPVFRLRPSHGPTVKSAADRALTVVPFQNLSKSTANESFGEGLTEELIHHLAQVSGLQVIVDQSNSRRISTLTRRDRSGIPKWHLRGSIRDAQGTLRIIAQLIETSHGAYIWSETYEPALDDLLSGQETVARAIVARFQATFEMSQLATKTG